MANPEVRSCSWGVSSKEIRARIVDYSLEDGSLKRSLDLREILTGKRVISCYHYGEGAAAICDDGSISFLSLIGEVLLTTRVKGEDRLGTVPDLVCHTPEGLFVLVHFPSLMSTSLSISVLDSRGETVFHLDGLTRVSTTGSGSKVIALGSSGRAGQETLYLLDLSGGKVNTFSTVIEKTRSYTLSSSGKYILALHESAGGGFGVAMYELDE